MVAVLTLLASGCWWPQVGWGPDRRSFNGAERSLTAANVASLFEFWTVELPQGSSEPIVGDGRLFVTSGFNLHAFTSSGGDSVWTRSIDTNMPEGFRGLGAPHVWQDDGEVAAQASRYEGSGRQTNRFVRYDAATGAVRPDVTSSGPEATQRGARLASSGSFFFPGGGVFNFVSVVDRAGGPSWGGIAPVSGTPTLGEARVYLAGSAHVSAFDPSTPCPPYQPGS